MTNMKRIYTSNAPEPIGPYAQGVEHNGVLYLSGQVAIDPASGELVMDTIEAETHQVMKNIEALLKESGTQFNNVIKCSIFLSDMENFSRVNAVYGSYFEDSVPARECVQVSRLPKDVNVEISVIAAV